MRKLNAKNKVYIVLFAIIILIIVGILVFSIRLANKDNNDKLSVNSNTVLFDDDYSLINTSNGGFIEKKWDDNYYYLDGNSKSFTLGMHPVIYDKVTQNVTVMGSSYQIFADGEVHYNKSTISNVSSKATSFYKLTDRNYLIISNEIADNEKTIYTTKYLLVYMDVLGNASLLNDSLDVKTINPLVLNFDDYTFDIANESLIVNDKTIDLKNVSGSTNKFVPSQSVDKKPVVDSEALVDAYNDLVKDFTKYVNNHNMVGSTNQVVNNTTNNVVVSGSGNTSNVGGSSGGSSAGANNDFSGLEDYLNNLNNTGLTKRVSLRSVVTYPGYLDISYVVTDPENKYQAVYLLVTGNNGDGNKTTKIMLDKYEIKHRITGLIPNNEYSIALGYIEVTTDASTKETVLVDQIADVINVRTKKIDSTISIDKIANGKVFFTFKTNESYSFSSATLGFYIDDSLSDTMEVDCDKSVTKDGFSSSFMIENGSVYMIRLDTAIYDGREVTGNVYKKFAISN